MENSWKQKLYNCAGVCTIDAKYNRTHQIWKLRHGEREGSYQIHCRFLQGAESNVEGKSHRALRLPCHACPHYLTSYPPLIPRILIEKILCSKKLCLNHFESQAPLVFFPANVFSGSLSLLNKMIFWSFLKCRHNSAAPE